MRTTGRKFLALLLAAMLLLSLCASAQADDGYEYGMLGSKTAEALTVPGQHEITISVPGAVETEEYSEIVVMVDASSSQGANLEKLKTMLVNLAEDVLHNDGSVRLTLMGFGMGPARVGSFYNAETLEAYLKNVTQADLRQGVSATNCEAALQFVHKYIEQSEKLHKTFVIFTSDGMTNMDETTFALSEWKEHTEWYMSGANASMIASYAAGAQADLLLTNGTILTPTGDLYPDEAVALALAENQYGIASEEYRAAVDTLYNAITATEESAVAYTDALWADVFAYSGLTYGSEGLYSTSRLEKAFLDYHDGVATNSYLCTIHGMKNASFYPDWYNLSTWGARAAAAADELAGSDKVLELYMMDFAGKNSTWMNPESTTANHCTSDKISYNTANNFSAAVDKIETLSNEMFVTVYKNATVVDPMSKWVTLDPSSIRIYEDDLLIYEYGKGWLYEDKQPAAEPITLTENEDGRYQITWRIKDGNLLFTDRYFLKYIVDVDETAEGFAYDTKYPANDPTYVEYTDASGEEQSSPIDVPEVSEPTAPEDFGEGDQGFKIYKGSRIDNTPISEISFSIYKVVPQAGDVLSEEPSFEEYSKYVTDENLVATVTTNGAGYASLNLSEHGLGKGFYLFIEEESSKVEAPVAPFYLSIPMPNPETGELMDVVTLYPKNEPVEPENPPIEPDIPDDDDEDTEGRISILKHNSVDPTVVLAGAEFQIYRLAGADEEAQMTVTYNGSEIGLLPVMNGGEPVMMITGENGVAVSPDLPFGMYFIIETTAPDGYDLLEEPIAVFVNATSDQTEIMVPNTPGLRLPETGGPGTVPMMAAGWLLVLAAAAAMVMKRRAY